MVLCAKFERKLCFRVQLWWISLLVCSLVIAASGLTSHGQPADGDVSEENIRTAFIASSRNPSNSGMVLKLNKAIDFMLAVARFLFTHHGHLTLPLPELNKTFSKYNGIFTASEGYFNNIGSLHRTGDIAFEKVNSSLSLDVALGLSELEAGYKKYALKILTISQGGDMKFTVDSNSLMMKMTFTYSPECRFFLEYIRFDVLQGVHVDITGLGAFQAFYNQLSGWLISNFEQRFKTIANDKMKGRLQEVLSRKSKQFCKYFPHF